MRATSLLEVARFLPLEATMASMATKRDYYEVLQVQRNASEREIANAYRQMAIRYHPDSHPGDAEATERFKEAAEAYEVLSDADKRARYDQFGHAGVDPQHGGGHAHDAEDIFEAFGEMFGFGDLFGRRRGRRVRPGNDILVDVELNLQEAARGVKRNVEVRRRVVCQNCRGSGARSGSSPKTCQRCGGRGQVVQAAGILRVQTTCPTCRGSGSIISDPCEVCGGQGLQVERVRIDVTIPAGVDDGMRVRVTGQGEPSLEGGPAGDCYCNIHVREHPLFKREGPNLLVQIPITYSQAALGAEIDVPTLDGKERLTVPPGTQPGTLFRLKRQGVPDPRGGRQGDLIVQTAIEVPTKLTSAQEKLLRELAQLEQVEISPHRKSFLEKLKDFFQPEEVEHDGD